MVESQRLDPTLPAVVSMDHTATILAPLAQWAPASAVTWLVAAVAVIVVVNAVFVSPLRARAYYAKQGSE